MKAPWLIALAILLPATAHAEDDELARQEGMHVGVGVESTLGGVAGVSFRQGLGPAVGVEGVLAIDHGEPAYVPGGVIGTATTIGIAGRAIVPVRRLDRGVISFVGGIDIGARKALDTSFEVAVEGGLRAEYFLAASLSVSFEVGAVVTHPPSMQSRILHPAVASGRPTPDSTAISLDNTTLAGGAGLTFWFR
jgi:hypothetical protein